MKIKCVLCSFFKNMWNDIKKEFKKPIDWSSIIPLFVIIPTVYGVIWLWDNYAEIIKLVFLYSCGGLSLLVFLAQVGAIIYFSCNWIKKLYLKSKEECQ